MPPGDRERPARQDIGPYLPIAILASAFLIGVLQQTVFALNTRSGLSAAEAQQQATYDQAVNFRSQLDAIAAEVAQLAASGDPAAKAIEDSLRQEGITLPPPKAP